MPIDFFFFDWLNLLLRWAHVITGIAWIGSSFYFIWLDQRLNVPPRNPENADVAGDLWAVHGGGFYHSQKYKVAPAELPEPLHWFKWEAYSTWLTGFALFIVVYYLNAGALLVDPAVARISVSTAIVTSLALLLGGWLVYDGLSRTGLSGMTFALVGGALLLGMCWGVTQIFGGRGAFMQIGAMIGTIMAGNVWRVIIPSQKQLVAAKLKGDAPDARLAAKAKQRSVHNNYLTLPVVFAMISPHFAFTYAHPYNWAVLFAIFVAGALIRHFFNLRNQGRPPVALPIAGLALLALVAIVTAPRGGGARTGADDVAFADVQRIVAARCVPCHSVKPTHPTAPVAAAGVMLDTSRQIAVWKQRIYDRTVVTRTMPFNNFTEMTEEERALLGRWYASGAHTD
jgi:uncharacterized membrane protein